MSKSRPFRRHRPTGGDRDTGLSGAAGKGDAVRIANKPQYDKNFDQINWGHRPAPTTAPTK